MSDTNTKIILETNNELGDYEPTLFIFKNSAGIMLTEPEIKLLKETIKDL